MNSAPHHQSSGPPIVTVLLGLMLLAAPANAATPGMQLAQSTQPSAQPEDSQKQPATTPDRSNSSGSEAPQQAQPSQPSSDRRESDRVYIEDIYPEYCRLYFHQRDWVSLFEYQTGMYRCLYGTDRN